MNNSKCNIDLSLVSGSFRNEINYYKKYVQFNIKKLNEWKEEIEDDERIDISNDLESINVIKSIYFEEKISIPNLFIGSTIISLFSFLDKYLKVVSQEVIIQTKFPFSINDISGRNIFEKSKSFFSDFAKVDYSKIDSVYIPLTKFYKLRNILTHYNPKIFENEGGKRKLLEGISGIIIDDKLNEIFLTDFNDLYVIIDKIDEYITYLSSEIESRRFTVFSQPEIKPMMPF